MANPICTTSTLNISCFRGQVIDNFRRKCLMVYFMAAELKGIGGTDYTATFITPSAGGLLGDTIAMGPGTTTDTRDLFGCRIIGLYELTIARNKAIASGGDVDVSIQTRMQQIKCLINVPEETLDRMLVLLACQLGVSKAYPQ